MTITLTVGGKQRNMDRCGGLRQPQQLAARAAELLPPAVLGGPCPPSHGVGPVAALQAQG